MSNISYATFSTVAAPKSWVSRHYSAAEISPSVHVNQSVEGGMLHLPITNQSTRAVDLISLVWTERFRTATLLGNNDAAISQEGETLKDGSSDETSILRSPVVLLDVRTGKKRIVEELWREFFSDPSQWWDHRSEKGNARYPDFKHKRTQKSLWLNGKLNPPWVAAELAQIAPGVVQCNIFSLNARLTRYVKAGKYRETIELFRQMQEEGRNLDRYTFVPVLNACSRLRALGEGRHVHRQIICSGLESNVYVGSSLVDMYAKCGRIEYARTLFNKMPTHDVVTWNAMILGYVKCGEGKKALKLYQQMHEEGVEPDSITFVGFLNACASLQALEEGRLIHRQVIQRGFEADVYVCSSLVDMYAKCGTIEHAHKIFNKMPTRNVVTWSSMIHGYVKCGQGSKALELSQRMQQEGVEPDSVTLVGMLNACASEVALEEGRSIHKHIIRRGFESDVFVGSSLVDMYAKCGDVEDAWKAFNKIPIRNVVCWNSMILGLVKHGEGWKALELSQQMQSEGVEPDPVTFVGFLNACASVSSLEEGKRIHDQIIQSGCESDVFVGNSLIDMYAKCGSIDDAFRVFNSMCTHTVVTWSAMIQGFVKYGQGHRALELFPQMQSEGVEPDSVTFVGILNACASVVALEQGKGVHREIIERGCEFDVSVSNSLVDMYANCGSIEDAQRVFDKMPTRDVVSWNAMLGGYAMHGHAKEAVGLFEQMREAGVRMDMITFVSLLSACSHGGLLDAGLHYFESMRSICGISATAEHYACVVDLLGRAGRLHEAEDLIKTMSFEPGLSVWMSLLGACRVNGNVEMGERIAKRVQELDSGNASGYVLLSNIYADAGKWESSLNIQDLRLKRGVKKQLG